MNWILFICGFIFFVVLISWIQKKRTFEKKLGRKITLEEMSEYLDKEQKEFDKKIKSNNKKTETLKNKSFSKKNNEYENIKINDKETLQESKNISLNFPLNPEDIQELHQSLLKSGNYKELEGLRDIEIIFESFYLISKSKNEETIKSRLALAKKLYNELGQEHFKLKKQIKDIYQEHLKQSYTLQYTNISDGYMEKAKKLKTLKSKIKYSDLALEKLQEGLENRHADKEVINTKIENINKYKEMINND